MVQDYTFIQDLSQEVAPPSQGIFSRTIYQDDRWKVVAFGFAEGEELSEHTASMPAMLHFISGRGTVTLGSDAQEFQPGSVAHLPPQLPHSIAARTPVVLLLVLLK